MASGRIASRYSKSLKDMAVRAGQLEEVKTDMQAVASICVESRDLSHLLRNPIVTIADKQAVLNRVFKNASKTSLDFIHFLVEKRREEALPLIAAQFLQAYDKMKRIARATVVSAVPLSTTTLDKLKRYVQTMVDADTIELHNEIDPSVIGGIVIKHEDKLLDMSVAKELREIRKELIYN